VVVNRNGKTINMIDKIDKMITEETEAVENTLKTVIKTIIGTMIGTDEVIEIETAVETETRVIESLKGK
jgi:hypothetical protein